MLEYVIYDILSNLKILILYLKLETFNNLIKQGFVMANLIKLLWTI